MKLSLSWVGREVAGSSQYRPPHCSSQLGVEREKGAVNSKQSNFFLEQVDSMWLFFTGPQSQRSPADQVDSMWLFFIGSQSQRSPADQVDSMWLFFTESQSQRSPAFLNNAPGLEAGFELTPSRLS